MKHVSRTLALILLALPILAGSTLAQTGPVITIIRLGQDSGGNDDVDFLGFKNEIAAYSMSTTSCNPGTVEVAWDNSDHPVIAQNFFRLKDGRFEQIGQSWLKHGFCAVNESGCGSCQATSCDTLGLGCADTYSASLNDGSNGGPKYTVNPTTGVHIDPHPSPTGPAPIAGRLQVHKPDIDPAQNAGAVFFAEGQYVSAHIQTTDNGHLASSWRKLEVLAVNTVNGIGPTVVSECAPYAWQSEDPQVVVTEFVNQDEGGAGYHGYYTLGYRVTDLGGGTGRYDCVVYNQTSGRAAGSLAGPLGSNVAISNVFFNDVDYHSGEPYDGTDWVATNGGNVFTWQTAEDYNTNPDANALRWGTMYSFGFDCNAAPVASLVDVSMFKPGPGTDVLQVAAMVPGDGGTVGLAYCFGDPGVGTPCPCSNDNDGSVPGSGCANGAFASGATLVGRGVASLSADTLVLTATGLHPLNSGLYCQANNDLSPGNVWGDGLQCAGGQLKRLGVRFSDASGASDTSAWATPISVKAGNILPGDTKRYQLWYRDTSGGQPCGVGVNDFNATNGYAITWGV